MVSGRADEGVEFPELELELCVEADGTDVEKGWIVQFGFEVAVDANNENTMKHSDTESILMLNVYSITLQEARLQRKREETTETVKFKNNNSIIDCWPGGLFSALYCSYYLATGYLFYYYRVRLS